MRLAENTGCKNDARKSPSDHHRTTLSGYIFATKAYIDNRKKNRVKHMFGVKLSNKDVAEIEGLRDVAMATNFGTKIATTVFVNDNDYAIGYGGGFECSADRMQILLIPCT